MALQESPQMPLWCPLLFLSSLRMDETHPHGFEGPFGHGRRGPLGIVFLQRVGLESTEAR